MGRSELLEEIVNQTGMKFVQRDPAILRVFPTYYWGWMNDANLMTALRMRKCNPRMKESSEGYVERI